MTSHVSRAKESLSTEAATKPVRPKARAAKTARPPSPLKTETDPLVIALSAIETLRLPSSQYKISELTEIMEPIFLNPVQTSSELASISDMFLSVLTFRPEVMDVWAKWMEFASTTAVEEEGYAAMTFAVYLVLDADTPSSVRAILKDTGPLTEYIETMIPGARVGIASTAFGLDYTLTPAESLQTWLRAAHEGVDAAQGVLAGTSDPNASANTDTKPLEDSCVLMLVGRIESEELSLKELKSGLRSTGADDEVMCLTLHANGRTIEADLQGMCEMSQAFMWLTPAVEDHVLWELMQLDDLTLVVEALKPLEDGTPALAAQTLIHAYDGTKLRDTFDMGWDVHPAMWYMALYPFFEDSILFTSAKMVAPPRLQSLFDSSDDTTTRH